MKFAPCLVAALILAFACPSSATQVIPTVYEAGHFYATPETRDGQTFRLLVDTGGGGGPWRLYWMTRAASKRLHLKTSTCTVEGNSFDVAALPDYKSGHSLPPPVSSPCGAVVMVLDAQGSNDDGQLGSSYLYAGGVWTFDYPRKRLVLEDDAWRPTAAAHETTLGFQRDDKGGVRYGFPRMTLRVDGQSVEMLLDTGATAHPTAEGKSLSGIDTVNGYGVTSYIAHSVFERWHRDHPEWRVVEHGDDVFGARHPTRIIEVPNVEIAGWSVGPVWFTERPDGNFHHMMSSLMDRQIEGAVGANVFRHFVMTMDYPHARAWFQCVEACRATPPPAP